MNYRNVVAMSLGILLGVVGCGTTVTAKIPPRSSSVSHSQDGATTHRRKPRSHLEDPTTVQVAPSLATLDMVSMRDGWAVTMQGHILRTMDGGSHWNNVASHEVIDALQHSSMLGGGDLGSVMGFPNALTAWITIPLTGNTVEIWHTNDGGVHWTLTTIPQAEVGLGLTQIAAWGKNTAWMVAATQGLAGQVAIRLWQTTTVSPQWHAIFQGSVVGISGLAFVTPSLGVLTEGNNVYQGPNSAAVAVTTNGGKTWTMTGNPVVNASNASGVVPILPGDWVTTVLAPVVIPQTEDVIVPVIMQSPVPSSPGMFAIRWQLDESPNGGQTWHALADTPHAVLSQVPNVIAQAWATSDAGWIALGSELYRTQNGGQTWEATALPGGQVVTLDRVSEQQGFVLMKQGTRTSIYRTQDGGQQWILLHWGNAP